MFHGMGHYKFNSGCTYIGQFVNNKLNGKVHHYMTVGFIDLCGWIDL
jgi:hypothetical protein